MIPVFPVWVIKWTVVAFSEVQTLEARQVLEGGAAKFNFEHARLIEFDGQ